MLWYFSIAAGIIGFALIAFLFTLLRTSLGWNKVFQHAMVIVVISLFLVVLAPSAEMAGGIPETFASAVYTLMQAASIQLAVGDLAGAAHEALSPGWATLYLTILNILAILTPALIVSTAILELRKWLVRNRIRMHTRSREAVYVFSGIGENELALAYDILANAELSGSRYAGVLGPRPTLKAKSHPLIIFCEVTDEVRDELSTEMGELQDLHRDDVVFTSNSITTMVSEIAPFPSVHCLLFTSDHSANVEGAIAFFDRLSSFIASTVPGEEIETYASKFHLYCLHADSNDELIFDTISHRVPHHRKGDPKPELLRLAQDSLEIRLVSEVEERIYSLFTRSPLYLAFKPAPLFEKKTVERDGESVLAMVEKSMEEEELPTTKKLVVIVCGLGQMGLEALKAAYWFGRMRNVQLQVIGIDQKAGAIRRQLVADCPVMMAERTEDGKPRVTILSAVAGTASLEEAITQISSDSYVYAIVTLGSDQLNLDTALQMRRTLERMRLDGRLDERHLPIIAPLIYSEQTQAAARHMATERDERYALTPFGASDEVYSFFEIIESVWERRAISMNAAYDECWASEGRGTTCKMWFGPYEGGKGVLHDYNCYEIKKLSNRTCTRHIPYRLWSAGFNPDDYLDEQGELIGEGLSQELWLRTLLGIPEGEPIDADVVDSLFKSGFDKNSTPAEAQAALDELRRRFPLLSELADIEHDRWVAFYASHGWRDLTIEECERLKRLGTIKKPDEHQSSLMRMHCYLCDIETLMKRGIALGEDPFRYDRAAIIEMARILSGSIFVEA